MSRIAQFRKLLAVPEREDEAPDAREMRGFLARLLELSEEEVEEDARL